MVRFFVDPAEMEKDHITLVGDNAAHAKVLRIKVGEQVTVCDGKGNECICIVRAASQNGTELSVEERKVSATEAKVRASVYVAFPKTDKLEHVIQKATELGACEVIAFPSARCVSKPDEKSLKKKLERWQKIAFSAAEQSGRGCVPDVLVMPDYRSALERAKQADLAILLYENEHATTLKMALESVEYQSVSLISGPEGGLEPSEVERASGLGIKICTLGSRILRCETAPLCALSAVMYQSGEF